MDLIAVELAEECDDAMARMREFGVGPSWPLKDGGPTLTVPAKFGLGLNDYYFDENGDSSAFGFFSVGGTVTLPLTSVSSRFGSWSIKGGVEVLMLGEGTEAVNINSDGETQRDRVRRLFRDRVHLLEARGCSCRSFRLRYNACRHGCGGTLVPL